MTGEEDTHKKQSPSSPQTPERSRQPTDDENPFVAFRRFADEQISSMLQSVMGLPSSFSQPRSERWAVFDEPGYQDAQRRQRQEYNNDEKTDKENASSNSNDAQSTKRISKPPNDPPKRSPDPENPFDIDMFFNLLYGRFWPDDVFSSRLFHPYSHPIFTSLTSSESPAWPVNYLMFSPYSPLHLECQARYRSHRDEGVFSSLMSSMNFSPEAECDPEEPKWREAFEDLLRLENGKPMIDRDPAALDKSERTGKDWLKGLVNRGSIGKQWKFAMGPEGQPWSSVTLDLFDHGRNDQRKEQTRTEPTKDEVANNKPMTEMDMYDRFLADVDARERGFFGGLNSPLLGFLLEDRRRRQNPESHHFETEHNDDKETWLELVSGGNKHSVLESKSTEARAPALVQNTADEQPTPTEKTATEKPNYVISTQTSTNRIRLADGSIQTKIVKTQRFADGREETNESAEIVSPPNREQGSGQGPGERKNGWFWKD